MMTASRTISFKGTFCFFSMNFISMNLPKQKKKSGEHRNDKNVVHEYMKQTKRKYFFYRIFLSPHSKNKNAKRPNLPKHSKKMDRWKS